MKILAADYLLTMDKSCDIIRNGAVIYNGSKIVEISFNKELAHSRYPNAEFSYVGKNSVIMPSLINAHTHLEFSKNTTSLVYGNFASWLQSVIDSKELTSDTNLENSMQKAIGQMKKSGIGAIGAISSFAKDIETLATSGLRVTLFNEILGIKEERADAVKSDFLRRFTSSQRYSSDMFTPAVSLHSTYSCSLGLMDFATDFAKENRLKICSHFMESEAERLWLEESKGELGAFFKSRFGIEKSVIKPIDFLKKFDSLPAIFVHCTHAAKNELEYMQKKGFFAVHCPVSNRLLGGKYFDVESANQIGATYATATDGLSSNFSLNLWNEMRCALFGYAGRNIEALCGELLKSVTLNAAKALGLNSGILKEGANADIIGFCLPGSVENDEQLALQVVLHTNKVNKLIINGIKTDE